MWGTCGKLPGGAFSRLPPIAFVYFSERVMSDQALSAVSHAQAPARNLSQPTKYY